MPANTANKRQIQNPKPIKRIGNASQARTFVRTTENTMITADIFYGYASILIFLPWVLLLFAPTWPYTEKIAFGAAIILFIAAAWFTFQFLTNPEESGNLLSLSGLENLFRSKSMLLTGWLNYLSFCLLVGVWQVHDGQQLKIHPIFLVPSLLLTMLTGPAGLLLYLIIRFFKTRKWDIR
jgi:hypothetical protein